MGNAFCKMKVITIIFIITVGGLTVNGQSTIWDIDYSPDKRFGLLVTSLQLEDLNTEWKYWIISDQKDTTRLTTATTHDEEPPAAFWSKLSTEIVFEEQIREGGENRIIVYDLIHKKKEFATTGFIWGKGKNNFDQERGILFYLIKTENQSNVFDLMTLNLITREIKKISSLKTSGDPYTGIPEVELIDKTSKHIILTFETADYRQEKIKFEY
jgi:hypothetical protein